MSELEEEILENEDDDDVASSQRRCIDCAIWAPRTRTEHTLISSKHGWRLERIAEGDGRYRFEWRCPKCWHSYKLRPQKA
jgi:hypothetical protein